MFLINILKHNGQEGEKMYKSDICISKDKNNIKLIKRLCFYLNYDFKKILGYNPEFKVLGSMENDYHRIYSNSIKRSLLKSVYKIDFNIDFCYLRRADVLEHIDYSILTDEQLDRKADYIRDITYIYINYVGVRPGGHGIGTKLMDIFIGRVKDINKIKKIYLHSKDERAKEFWEKIGFLKINNEIAMNDKIYPFDKCPDMVLYI